MPKPFISFRQCAGNALWSQRRRRSRLYPFLFNTLLYLQAMRILSTAFIFVIFGLLSCTRQTDRLTREEAIAVIRCFDEGWKNKNLSAVDSVLAPSYIYFTQSGGIFSRANLVQTAGSPEYSLERVERMEYYVTLYENTAVVSTRWQGKGVYKGVSFNEDQRCSLAIIKTKSKVEILSEHCTPIRPNRVLH